MSEESKQKLYIYNGIDSQLEEIKDLTDAKDYIKDYIEDGDIHPDIESIIILQQVGGVHIEETGEFSELNGDTVPVCKVDVLIDKTDIDDYKEVLEDKHRLTLEIEKAMFGENGAKNPSLCDVLKSVIDMKSRIDELEEIVLSARRFYGKPHRVDGDFYRKDYERMIRVCNEINQKNNLQKN